MLKTDRRRVAAIEIGSRAVRLLVADVADDLLEIGAATELTDLAAGLRLAGGDLARALEKVNRAVPRFVARAQALEASTITVFGTAVVRSLCESSSILPFDFPVKVLSSAVEARCSLVAAIVGLPTKLPAHGNVLAIDLGAGSIEFAFGHRSGRKVSLDAQQSIVMGTDMLGAEFRRFDRNIFNMYKWVRDRISREELSPQFSSPPDIVAMGSAATKLGWLVAITKRTRDTSSDSKPRVVGVYERNAAHGQEVTKGNIGRLLHAATADPQKIRTLLDRRIEDFSEFDNVIPGCMLLDSALARFGAKMFVASGWGTRHGVAWLLANDGQSDIAGAETP